MSRTSLTDLEISLIEAYRSDEQTFKEFVGNLSEEELNQLFEAGVPTVAPTAAYQAGSPYRGRGSAGLARPLAPTPAAPKPVAPTPAAPYQGRGSAGKGVYAPMRPATPVQASAPASTTTVAKTVPAPIRPAPPASSQLAPVPGIAVTPPRQPASTSSVPSQVASTIKPRTAISSTSQTPAPAAKPAPQRAATPVRRQAATKPAPKFGFGGGNHDTAAGAFAKSFGNVNEKRLAESFEKFIRNRFLKG